VHGAHALCNLQRWPHLLVKHLLHLCLWQLLAVRIQHRPVEPLPQILWTRSHMVHQEVVLLHQIPYTQLLAKLLLTPVETGHETLKAQLAVQHSRHLFPPHWLPEVPVVHHVACTPQHQLYCTIRTHQHGHSSSSSHEPVLCISICNVCGHSYGPPPVPRLALHPVHTVQQSSCAPVAGIVRIHTLDVAAAVGLEQLHEVAFNTLAAVHKGLSSHLQHAHLLPGDLMSLHQPAHYGECHGHCIFILPTA